MDGVNTPLKDSGPKTLPRAVEERKKRMIRLAAGQTLLPNPQNLNRLHDEKTRIEAAKAAAWRNAPETSRLISAYCIEDEEVRVEIARIALNQDVWGALQSIRNYAITDQVQQTKLIKIAAAQDVRGASAYLQSCRIRDEGARIELAQCAMRSDPAAASRYMQRFRIRDEGARVELAKLAARRDPAGLSKQLARYALQEEASRLEVAKEAVCSNVLAASKYLKRYRLQDEKARIELAKLAVRQRVKGFSKYLQNYAISEEKARLEIAAAAIEQSPSLASQSIRDYALADERGRLALFLFALGEGLSNIRHLTHFNFTPEREKRLKRLASLLEKLPAQREGLVEEIELLSRELEIGLKGIPQKLKQLEKVSLLQHFCCWLFTLFGLSGLDQGVKSCWNFHAKAIQALFAYRSPKQRLEITQRLSKAFAAEPRFFCSGKNDFTGIQIPLLLLKALCAQKRISRRRCKQLEEFLTASRAAYKKVSLLKTLVDALLELLRDSKQTEEKTTFLLELILPPFKGGSNRQARLAAKEREPLQRALKGIYDFSQERLLKKELLENYSLIELFEACFCERMHCKGEHLFLNYERIFRASRDRQAYLTYASKICPSNQPEIAKSFGRFIDSLLEGRFAEERYCKEASRHLRWLAESYPDLLEKWKQDPSLPLEALLNKPSRFDPSHVKTKGFLVVDTDHFDDLFLCGTEVLGSCQHVNRDLSLNKCLLGYVLDGKVRLLAVKNARGVIQARAILKILWSETRPALFMERIYPETASREMKQALQEMAKKRARSLPVELFTKGEAGSARLASLGNPAPFEYVDANSKVTEGEYEIRRSLEVPLA